MYKFLKISLRHLWVNRLYAAINIVGLATAGTCMLFAVLYWKDEHSYDDFHSANPYLYRITTNSIQQDGKQLVTGGTGQVQGPAFKSEIPEIKSFVRVLGGEIYNDLKLENKSFRVNSLFVDSNFFKVFSFKLLKGKPDHVLSDINAVVITESTARKFFNSIDVIGRLLKMGADPSFERLGKAMMITGVVQDPPKNSSLQFDALFTFKFLNLSFEDNNWLNSYLGTFVVLQPGVNMNAVLKKFNVVHARKAKQQIANNIGYNQQINYDLQRITDIHLNPLAVESGNAEGGVANGSTSVYSYLFMSVSLFILLMAVINFINISIANSFKRAKEIGIRKISGGNQKQILFLLLNESAILCGIAFLFSIVIMNACLPLFNNLSGKQLIFSAAFDLKLAGICVILLLLIIVLTGIYPAYLLSNFKPRQVLYNKQKLTGNSLFGKGLVVLQFSLSIFLLIATIIYYQQMDFVRTKDLGYNPNQIIRTAIYGNRDYPSLIRFMQNEFKKEPSIAMVSFGNDGMPEDISANQRTMKGQVKNIDENFLPLMNISLLAGRNLSPSFSADKTEGVLVNETFVRSYNIKNPIGESIRVNLNFDGAQKIIRGVVKDFHFGSLREPIKPMVLYMSETPSGGIWFKFEKNKQQQALSAFKRIYMSAMPDAVFNYQFLDELNAAQYFQEQRWQKVINIATVLSLVICCLGLFGLAHLSANQRIKEIGIRKVLGAGIREVCALLSKDFLKLVVIACLLAFPLAGVVMGNWLHSYAYRIDFGWPVFVAGGGAAICIAMATVSFHAIKAALANPVKSLRSE